MPRIAAIDRLSDARAARKQERARKRALGADERHARRIALLKAVGCILLLAVFGALGFVVGNDEYRATLIGWVPFVMTLTGIVLAAIYLAVLRRGISFEEQLLASECQRDSDVTFGVSFKNRTPLMATRMKASFFIADMFDNVANEQSTTLGLAPFEERNMGFSVRFEHIGSYHAGLGSIEVADFLGLFTHVIENDSKQVVRVTPKIVELDGIKFSNEAMDEATKAAKSVLADSMDYAYVREYEQGDPLKTIHWKLSARANNYMTRLYEVYTNPSVIIVMDFYGPSDEARDLMSMFDCVVESAFSLSRYSRRHGMDVEIHYCNKYGQEQALTGPANRNVADIVADLPRMSNDPADAAAALDIITKQVANARGFNNIFICSANVGSDMVSAVIEAKLRRRTPHFVAVVPPGLLGREREDYCSALASLDSADVTYTIVAHAGELSAGGDIS